MDERSVKVDYLTEYAPFISYENSSIVSDIPSRDQRVIVININVIGSSSPEKIPLKP